ncbi:response regulator transcription factor [Streptomyces sp. NPDC051907]|uniref:response regulator transcription factor n=1 Tax=Streptomyces sp. NPDC051907 TaxID=3155284 RepID=UPI00344449DC
MPDDVSRSSGQNWTQQSHVSQHTSSHATPLSSDQTTGTLRVVVADDNPVVRAGLTVLLQGRADLVVVAEAADGREAYDAAVQHRPDVVLLDVRMPRVDGLSALPHLVRLAPVLMMTYSRESEIVREALRLGASGYLVHGEFTVDELTAAVRDIKRGRSRFSPSASHALASGARDSRDARGRSQEPQAPHGPQGVRRQFAQPSSLSQADMAHSTRGPNVVRGLHGVITELSQREVEVMDLITSGMTNQQIAASCFISEKTVKNHINRIFAKLNAGSRGEAIAIWHSVTRGGAGRHA